MAADATLIHSTSTGTARHLVAFKRNAFDPTGQVATPRHTRSQSSLITRVLLGQHCVLAYEGSRVPHSHSGMHVSSTAQHPGCTLQLYSAARRAVSGTTGRLPGKGSAAICAGAMMHCALCCKCSVRSP